MMYPPAFTLFPSLPNELRQLVWLFTLPGPRKVIPFTTYNVKFFYEPGKAPKNHCPVTLRINRESRAVALRHYSNWYNAAALGYQYVDFNIDTICFNASDFEQKEASRWAPEVRMALLKLSRADLWRITRLEITFSEDNFARDLKGWITRLLTTLFFSVKELKIVWVDKVTMNGLRTPRYGGTDACWNKVKIEINTAMELANDCLEEIEKQRGGGWKAPILSIVS